MTRGHPGANTKTASLSLSCSPIFKEKKKKKKGTEGMCETCNHGYPSALSLVTPFGWKTPAVVVDQFWGKQFFLLEKRPVAAHFLPKKPAYHRNVAEK